MWRIDWATPTKEGSTYCISLAECKQTQVDLQNAGYTIIRVESVH